MNIDRHLLKMPIVDALSSSEISLLDQLMDEIACESEIQIT